MTNDSIVFKYNGSDAELQNIRKRKMLVWYIMLGALIGVLGFFFFMLVDIGIVMLQNLRMIISFITLFCLLWVSIKMMRDRKFFFDHLHEKTFTVYPEEKKFHYHDAEQDFTFTADDIKNWYMTTSNEIQRRKSRTGADAFDFKKGGKIVIEDIFNNEVHAYLIEHRYSLSLPERTHIVKVF